MDFDMDGSRKGSEWASNEFTSLDSPTLLVVMVSLLNCVKVIRIRE